MGRNSGTGGRGRRPGAAGIRRGVGGGAAQLGAPAGPVAEVLPPRVEVPQAPLRTENLLRETRVLRDGPLVQYETNLASGNRVTLSVYTTNGDGDITFSVNGLLSRGQLSQAESNAVSLRLLRNIREDARTRPDGYTYHAFAATGDGFGLERGRAYEAIGMTRPVRGAIAGTQYAVVRNGKLVPDMERLRRAEGGDLTLGNRIWRTLTQNSRNARAADR